MGFSCGWEMNYDIQQSIPVPVSHFTFVCSMPKGTEYCLNEHIPITASHLALLFGWSHTIFWDAQHMLPTWGIKAS